ncbi:hypothetical protein [Gloeobacter violaceus]|uniref:hypothetical protein n=1 Tax=Gloeobacter violaceus TaxID=33072 RepID=UPI0013E8CDAE|nr:hypothetical protein [Gloeobacter violaceus]
MRRKADQQGVASKYKTVCNATKKTDGLDLAPVQEVIDELTNKNLHRLYRVTSAETAAFTGRFELAYGTILKQHTQACPVF